MFMNEVEYYLGLLKLLNNFFPFVKEANSVLLLILFYITFEVCDFLPHNIVGMVTVV